MGMLDNFLRDLTRPFREIKGKWMGIQNVKDGLAADAKRIKGYADDAKKQAKDAQGKAKEAADKAKGYGDQAKAAHGQAQGALGAAQAKVQGVAGMIPGGKPGGPPPKGGGPAPGGMQPGMPAGGPGMMPGAPGMMPGAAPGMMPGAPGMAYGGAPAGYGAAPGAYGAAPGGYGMPMGGPPQPGNRTMAIMAGGSAGYALGWFVPLKGPQRGELITLKPQSVIGKDPTCEVCINDPFLSGRHATVRAQNGVFVLEDHSTNGTWVNDKKVTRHELVDSDFVKVGQTLMKFKAL